MLGCIQFDDYDDEQPSIAMPCHAAQPYYKLGFTALAQPLDTPVDALQVHILGNTAPHDCLKNSRLFLMSDDE